ncbi:MAG: S9 family peptidase [Candidatus Marinimicrobia bacterium]|nr:S9 family peptidase [Candidatus Neomarinimicrobiota bacterium]
MKLGSSVTSEVHFLEISNSNVKFKIINSREQNHEYSVDHRGDEFFIHTNYRAKNFRLMKTPIDKPSKKNWKEVIPHRKNIMLEDFDIFEDYLATYELNDGITKIKIINFEEKKSHYIKFNEEIYSIFKETNPEFDTPILRFSYSSLITPEKIIDYNMKTKKEKIVKKERVLGYNPLSYKVKREYAIAEDGVEIPISLAYKKRTRKNGKNPMFLIGYGSYGVTSKPSFSSQIINLLVKRFILAIAHIRGGCEKGREWYESGKFLKKKNTFKDFISCAKYLINKKYTSKERLIIFSH